MTKCVMHMKQILGLLLKIKSIPNYQQRQSFSPMCFNTRHLSEKFGKNKVETDI